MARAGETASRSDLAGRRRRCAAAGTAGGLQPDGLRSGVAFSGGKAMRGPNDTGLLLGRRHLVAAAKLNANPHCGTIGRMMKVSKEDMIALLAAVERFVHLDHEAELRQL